MLYNTIRHFHLSSLSPFGRQETARVTVIESKPGLVHVSISQTFGSPDTLKEMKPSSMNCITICQPVSICSGVNCDKPSAQLWHCPSVTHSDPSAHPPKASPSSPLLSWSRLSAKQLCCSNTAETSPHPQLKLQLRAALLLLSRKLHEFLCTEAQPRENCTHSVFFRSICCSSASDLSCKFYYKTLGCKTQKLHTRTKQ